MRCREYESKISGARHRLRRHHRATWRCDRGHPCRTHPLERSRTKTAHGNQSRTYRFTESMPVHEIVRLHCNKKKHPKKKTKQKQKKTKKHTTTKAIH